MRTDLSPSLLNHLDGSFFRPAFLVEIAVPGSASLQWSSSEAVNWNGDYWAPLGFLIEGLSWDYKISGNISIKIQVLDGVILSLLLNESFADRNVKIWMVYLYEKSIMRSDAGMYQGSTKLIVTEPIPADTASSGTIYIGTNAVSYSSWAGRTFNLSSGLPLAVNYNQPVYTVKASYNPSDAVQIFNGVVDDIEFDDRSCSINLVPSSVKTQYTPRFYITKYNGFNFLPQNGTKVFWGKQTYILEKQKN